MSVGAVFIIQWYRHNERSKTKKPHDFKSSQHLAYILAAGINNTPKLFFLQEHQINHRLHARIVMRIVLRALPSGYKFGLVCTLHSFEPEQVFTQIPVR